MIPNSNLESFDSARYAIRSWKPVDKTSDELKQEILNFLDIVEEERDRLLKHCEAKNAEQLQIEMALCHTEDAISITTAEGIIRMVNPAFEHLTSYHGYDIIGKNHDRFWANNNSSGIEAMKSSISSGYDWKGELSICSKNGECFDVQTSVAPIIHPDGTITHFVYTLHNITHRIKLERRLQKQKRFLEKVINLNPSVIIILDANGEWVLDNLAAKTLISDMGADARYHLSSLLLAGIREQRSNNPEKLVLTMPKGNLMSFMLLSEEIPSRYLMPETLNNNIVYLITLSDITAHEKKNQEILIRQKALLASRIEKNMIQGEFINGFIYHLQRPLNVSRAAISRIESEMEQHRYDQIEKTVLLLKQELEFLEKELSKFRTIPQSYPQKTEMTESTELSDAIKVLYEDQFKNGNIELFSKSDNSIVYPLPYEIMQLVLKILIDNALESMGGKTWTARINVIFSRIKDSTLLIVEDNGPGIEKKERYKVFEPFYTTKKNHSGLSLTIMHQLLNNIGGSVNLSCSELGGVKMTLFFPMESL